MDKKVFPEWYFMPYSRNRGSWNMALDYYLAEGFGEVIDKPVLRFYGWNPWCLSLGIHQNEKEVNADACRDMGIDIVRRPTGGRAVLHSEELTYSVIVPPEYMSLQEIYEFIHIVFSSALQKLGVPAVLEENQPDLREFYKKKHSSLCFASAARTEVKIGRKKLIGSAQHLFRNSILQHGSILIGSYHRNIVHLFSYSEKEKETFLKILERSTAELHQYLPEAEPLMLQEKFLEEFNLRDIHFVPLKLSPEDLVHMEELERKFRVIEYEIRNL